MCVGVMLAALAVTMLSACTQDARTQFYASRPIRRIIPWLPGGDTDVIGRVIFQLMFGETLEWSNSY